MDVDHCLRLLQSASSDNDKMAALMLVARLVKSDEIGPEGRKRVFNAVGFSFINRLFATNETPNDCVENPYHKIAVTILSCFCTDQDMILHPQVTSKIPHLNNFVQTIYSGQSSLAEDSLQCLKALSCLPEGIHHLMKYHSLSALTQAYISQNCVSDIAKDTLLGLLGQVFAQKLDNISGVLEVITILASKFRSNQDHLKFDICDTLCSVMRLSGHLCSADDVRVKDISYGLRDIFYSKVDHQRRECALHLSAIMCEMYGLEWTVHVDSRTKFLLLWLHLVALEVRLAVDGNGFNVIVGRSSLLCSSFVILEASIVFVSKHSDQAHPVGLLSSEFLLQLHTVLNEAFTSVLYLLNMVASWRKEETSTFVVRTPDADAWRLSLAQYPIIAASVRVLGAWLAEDTLTLADEVYKLFPFLLELASTSYPEEEDEDLLKFLLPGLCHMTADDKARPVLMVTGLGMILERYMNKLWPLAKQSSGLRDRFCLCCGVLQNICVSSPEDVKKFKASFGSIASLLTEVFAEYGGGSLLGMNAIVLFVMINKRGECAMVDKWLPSWEPVFKALMTPVTSSRASASEDDDMSELWFVGTEELSSLLENKESLKEEASRWISKSSK